MSNSVTVNKSAAVIGGGLAGLSSAVFLAQKGIRVTLIEASPKLGGRVYSFFDKTSGLTIDNGQHILASWYKNTFEYLKLIGTYDKLSFQKQLEVIFADANGAQYSLKASKLPPPLHLAGGIMGYKALGLSDKLSIVKLVNRIKKNRYTEPELLNMNTDELFRLSSQTDKAISYFWKPFIIAVFNAEPENTSASMFSDMIKLGFIEKGGSELVLPKGFLSEIFIKPAIEYLERNGSKVISNSRISEIKINNNAVSEIILEDNTAVKTDFYVSAVPFFNFKNLLSEADHKKYFKGLEELTSSPIVNIHLKFDSEISGILKTDFAGLLNTTSQWVFRVTNDQVCVVISSAVAAAEMNKDDLAELAVNELNQCLPEFKKLKVTASRVLKEMRATFIPDKNSLRRRPDCITEVSNMFLAGDWTNTGLPATIEGAVKSGKTAANEILKLN